MTEYTPDDEQMQADWHAYITTPDPENYYYDALSAEEADARWARWLAAHDARVRRDAAREALDGYADALNRNRSAAVWEWPEFVADVREWAAYNYPEESP